MSAAHLEGMSLCPNNVWNHTAGCVCVANGRAANEVSLDVDLMDRGVALGRDDAYREALNEYEDLYAQAHTDGYVRPSDPGNGRGEAWTVELHEIRARAEKSFDEAELNGEYGATVAAARNALEGADDEYFSRPEHRASRVRALTKELRQARRDAGVTDPRDTIRSIEDSVREFDSPTSPRHDDAINEYGSGSAVFRTWESVHRDYRSVDGKGRRRVLTASKTRGTVLVPHLGPEALEEWYGDQVVFGPDRPAAAAKAITEYAAANAAREARPWDDSTLRTLNHTKRLRDAYSEYGDSFRHH